MKLATTAAYHVLLILTMTITCHAHVGVEQELEGHARASFRDSNEPKEDIISSIGDVEVVEDRDLKKCVAKGKKCTKTSDCCKPNTYKCLKKGLGRKCAKPVVDKCANGKLVASLDQCGGKGYTGCKRCVAGNVCVYSTADLSVCLPVDDPVPPVADNCVVNVGFQCGGEGWFGCQNCKRGSLCAIEGSFGSFCRIGGKVPNAATDTYFENKQVSMLGSWTVKGLDPILDQELLDIKKDPLAKNKTLYEDARGRIAAVIATAKGRKKLRQLLMNDAEFQTVNAKASKDLKSDYCSTIQGTASLVSQEVRDCVCGEDSAVNPFLYCAALLEQEVVSFVESEERKLKQTRHHRNLRQEQDSQELSFTFASSGSDIGSRELQPKCKIDTSGLGGPLLNFALGLLGVIENGTAAACVGASCNVPIGSLPLLAKFAFQACTPLVARSEQALLAIAANSTNPKSVNPRRVAAQLTSISLSATVCVTGASSKLLKALQFLGVNLCFATLKGTVRPFLGTVEGQLIATARVVSLTGNLLFQAATARRDRLGLCNVGGPTACANGKFEDCAMCQGDLRASVDVAVTLAFRTLFAGKIAGSSSITGCAVTTNGQCVNGF